MADSTVKIARGASFLVFNTSFGALIGVAAFALISRLITKTEMGIMTTLLMVTSTCQLASTLGLPNASTKFIAESMGKEDVELASAISSEVLRVNVFAASIMAVFCLGLSEVFSTVLLGSAQYVLLFQVLALNIFFASLLPGFTGVLLGLKRLRDVAAFGLVSLVLQQTLVVFLLLSRFGLFGLIIGWTVANAFNCAFFLWSVMQSLPLSLTKRFNLGKLLRYSWPLYLVAFVAFVDNWFDRVLMLRHSLGELGTYNVAFKAFSYLYAMPVAIAEGFFPHFSELRSREGLDRLSRALTSTSRYLSLLFTPLTLGLATLSTPAISLFAGKIYASAGQPLTVLCVAMAVSVLWLILGKILLVLDQTLLYASMILSSVFAGLLLGVFFVPLFGSLGASIARALSMILALIFLAAATSKKINLKIDTGALWRSWVAGLVMAAALLLAQSVSTGLLLLPLYVAAGSLIYALMLRALRAVTETDVRFLERFLGDRIGRPVAKVLRAVLIP